MFPEQAYQALTTYLRLAIGFKGGSALATTSLADFIGDHVPLQSGGWHTVTVRPQPTPLLNHELFVARAVALG